VAPPRLCGAPNETSRLDESLPFTLCSVVRPICGRLPLAAARTRKGHSAPPGRGEDGRRWRRDAGSTPAEMGLPTWQWAAHCKFLQCHCIQAESTYLTLHQTPFNASSDSVRRKARSAFATRGALLTTAGLWPSPNSCPLLCFLHHCFPSPPHSPHPHAIQPPNC